MNAIYWTCRKCNNIGVVYPLAHDSAHAVLVIIAGDHEDANEDYRCDLDLAEIKVSREPNARHKAAVREAARA